MKANKKNRKTNTEHIRKTWDINPKTRVVPSEKKYKRSKFKGIPQE